MEVCQCLCYTLQITGTSVIINSAQQISCQSKQTFVRMKMCAGAKPAKLWQIATWCGTGLQNLKNRLVFPFLTDASPFLTVIEIMITAGLPSMFKFQPKCFFKPSYACFDLYWVEHLCITSKVASNNVRCACDGGQSRYQLLWL